MSGERELIGLHRLVASQTGLRPELENALRPGFGYAINVILFPAWEARMPGEAPLFHVEPVTDGSNIVSFTPRQTKIRSRP